MSEEVIKILDNLAERFGIAVDWTSTNIIPYLQQLSGKCVKYEMATSVMWLVIGAITLLIAIFLGRYLYKNLYKLEEEEYDCDAYLVLVVIFLSLIVAGIIITITQTLDIIACYTFPEKIVIEELLQISSSLK